MTVKNSRKKSYKAKGISTIFLVLAISYLTIIYSNIPIINKYRNIYIETAMSTMTHQWLATSFIPKSVIDKVISGRDSMEIKKGNGKNGFITSSNENRKKLKGRDWFMAEFEEIDMNSFDNYAKNNKNVLKDGYENIFIDNSNIGDSKTGIVTLNGDNVVAIDSKNQIIIIEVKGSQYNGRLAIVKNPSKVKVGLAEGLERDLKNDGSQIDQISKYNNSILSINASGFNDPNGNGMGGQPLGEIIMGGKVLNTAVGKSWFNVGFDYNNKMIVGRNIGPKILRDAVEFKPALIIDGVKQVDGSSGWGIQPRTAIGQKENLDVLMLVIDGRQINHSIGATVGDCANIMESYGAVQACNLDGGSSSIMYYNNHPVTKPSIRYDVGRWIPNVFMVEN